MPPAQQPQPKPDDVAGVAQWIADTQREAEVLHQSSQGERMSFRKLSREEYANTIRDLLHVNYDVEDPTGLPEDPDWQGFQRIGSVLTLSPAHIEKYIAAADMVLQEALPRGMQPQRETIHWGPIEIRGWKSFAEDYQSRGILDKVRVDLVPNNGALDTQVIKIKTAGDYLVRVKLSGLRPEGGRAPRLRLYADSISRVLHEQDVEAAEDAPIQIEFRTHLPSGSHPIRIMNAVPGPNPEARRSRASGTPNIFTGLDSRVPWQIKFTDDEGRAFIPFLLLDSIDWEGPLAEWPTPAYLEIFGNTEGNTEIGNTENEAKNLEHAELVVSKFAQRAWRRPLDKEDTQRLMSVVDRGLQRGEVFDASIKDALMVVLCSKSFLYLEEGRHATDAQRLTDWELASRLSYFLWSSMPDAQLFDLARSGKLHERETLQAEVHRMLADPKAAAFSDSFPRQWLQLRRVGMFAPDKELYPEYDDNLEQSMIAETITFFREVLNNGLGLRQFVDSNWTMLNERLAAHYGIAGVTGDALQRFDLSPENHRGGLLTHAAILSLTSDGTRHRPVHRGVWILESMVGRPPPPPPANVPALDSPPGDAPKRTVRETLALHRADPNCTACHRKIDPLGLAFDNYDAIGRWREVEKVRSGTGDDPRLDPSGELNDGRKFSGPEELKVLLMEDLDVFATAFTEKLATYALRRGMTFSDRLALKELVNQAKASDFKLASLIELLVVSDLFQKR
jgi:hypothetical protein